MTSVQIFRASIMALLLALPLRSVAQDATNGKALYDTYCAACHSTGAAGAPKSGDAAAWGPRIATGLKALQTSALKGKGVMPPKGGAASLNDGQVLAAVSYMVGLVSTTDASAAKSRPAAKAAEPEKPAAPQAAAGTTGDPAKGKLIYQASCAACHSSGLAGAPKLGDAAAWAPRTGNGPAALYVSATKGKGAMPPKGGNAALPDADLRAAVDFMLSQLRPSAAVAPATPAVQVAVAAPVATPGASAPSSRDVGDPNAFNRLMVEPGKRNLPPLEDGIHDAESPGTALLQTPSRAFQALPRSNLGNFVDWVASLAKKQIQPRWDARDPRVEATVMDLDIVREVKGSMPDVVFPHKQHTEWLDCSNCHPAIFIPQKGANQISMASIMLGQKCGACHGRVAFPISECRLCHSRQKAAMSRTAEVQSQSGGKP